MIPAKKSLGQNFLKSKEALRAIVDAGKLSPSDVVLEIGPGKGVLTEALLEKAGKVVAVEKDDRLIGFLSEKFKNVIESKKLELIHGDILEFDPGQLKECYKLVANIPYNITGILLQKFLVDAAQPSTMVLMLQKEVAQRITARDPATNQPNNKESILSLSIKAYGTPRYVMTVKAKYFSPEPNVDSAVIAIENISKNFFSDISEDDFFEVVKAGFAHKRKMLVGNLKSVFPYETDDIQKILAACGINEKARAEDLSLEQWKKLAIAIPKK